MVVASSDSSDSERLVIRAGDLGLVQAYYGAIWPGRTVQHGPSIFRPFDPHDPLTAASRLGFPEARRWHAGCCVRAGWAIEGVRSTTLVVLSSDRAVHGGPIFSTRDTTGLVERRGR